MTYQQYIEALALIESFEDDAREGYRHFGEAARARLIILEPHILDVTYLLKELVAEYDEKNRVSDFDSKSSARKRAESKGAA